MISINHLFEISDETKDKLKKAGKTVAKIGAIGASIGGAAYAIKNPEEAGEKIGGAVRTAGKAIKTVGKKFASGFQDKSIGAKIGRAFTKDEGVGEKLAKGVGKLAAKTSKSYQDSM